MHDFQSFVYDKSKYIKSAKDYFAKDKIKYQNLYTPTNKWTNNTYTHPHIYKHAQLPFNAWWNYDIF